MYAVYMASQDLGSRHLWRCRHYSDYTISFMNKRGCQRSQNSVSVLKDDNDDDDDIHVVKNREGRPTLLLLR